MKTPRAVADNENTSVIRFEVSESVHPILDDQRAKLDQVNPKLPGKQRYDSARELGCFATIAKGAKDRELKPDRIFIPGTEMSHRNGGVRIAPLKTTIEDVPSSVRVKSASFIRENGSWTGRLEVSEAAPVAA